MTDTSGFSAHPVTGTFIGYRWWDLYLNGGGPSHFFVPSFPSLPGFSPARPPLLCGAWAAWQPGENRASCLVPWMSISISGGIIQTLPDSHPAPGTACHCGYWAFWGKPFYWRTAPDVDAVSALEDSRIVPVLGVAEGWGRTLKGSLGFRCEYAKVTALLAPPAYKDLLSQLQPQAMIYTSARAMFGEHPAGIMGNKTE